MASFLLATAGLTALSEEGPVAEVPDMEVSDRESDYCTSEGAGLWIPVFLKFIEKKVRKLGKDPSFTFSDTDNLDADTLGEIESPYIRSLVIRFCNEQYEEWHDQDVKLPDYDEVHEGCRSYCDDCDSGWHTEYGEYDGPAPEDVAPDEDIEDPGAGEEERSARIERNRERQRERIRRERARDHAEAEEVGREFVCDGDCDSFCDRVLEAYREAFSIDETELEARWQLFLRKGRPGRFPPLHVSP